MSEIYSMYNTNGLTIDRDAGRVFVSVGATPGSDPYNPPQDASGSVHSYDPQFKVIKHSHCQLVL